MAFNRKTWKETGDSSISEASDASESSSSSRFSSESSATSLLPKDNELFEFANDPDGYEGFLSYLTSHDFDLDNEHPETGNTLIELAAANGSPDTVKYLLDSDVSLDASRQDRNLFEFALLNENKEILNLLSDPEKAWYRYFNDGTTSLHAAAVRGDIQTIAAIFDNEPERMLERTIRDENVIYWANLSRQYAVIEFLIDHADFLNTFRRDYHADKCRDVAFSNELLGDHYLECGNEAQAITCYTNACTEMLKIEQEDMTNDDVNDAKELLKKMEELCQQASDEAHAIPHEQTSDKSSELDSFTTQCSDSSTEASSCTDTETSWDSESSFYLETLFPNNKAVDDEASYGLGTLFSGDNIERRSNVSELDQAIHEAGVNHEDDTSSYASSNYDDLACVAPMSLAEGLTLLANYKMALNQLQQVMPTLSQLEACVQQINDQLAGMVVSSSVLSGMSKSLEELNQEIWELTNNCIARFGSANLFSSEADSVTEAIENQISLVGMNVLNNISTVFENASAVFRNETSVSRRADTDEFSDVPFLLMRPGSPTFFAMRRQDSNDRLPRLIMEPDPANEHDSTYLQRASIN